MNLLLDFGNTRLKWGLTEAGGAVTASRLAARGSVDYTAEALAAWVVNLPLRQVHQIRYASVVDSSREQQVLSHLPTTLMRQRIEVASVAAKLHNAYASQETLGVDRWLAAIGAWTSVGKACLVIGAGTATTVDLIETAQETGHGIYRGGLILPGIDLMHQALHQGTARLPDTPGRYRCAPDVADNTADAITSGIFEATCGAIERMGRRLPNDAPWLLTGGHAVALSHVLAGRAAVMNDLVLEGLASGAC